MIPAEGITTRVAFGETPSHLLKNPRQAQPGCGCQKIAEDYHVGNLGFGHVSGGNDVAELGES
jgi:hypothetical protein